MTPKELKFASTWLASLQERGVDTMAEARILLAAAGDGLSVSEIQEQTEMPMSTVSRVLWALSQGGWLEYAQHPTDRRKKIVTVSREL